MTPPNRSTIGRANTAIDAMRRRSPAGDRDRGAAALWLAVVMSVLLVLCGVVFDGGAVFAARGRAADVAQQAARAGADALTADTVFGGGGVAGLRAHRAAAATAARAVLTAAGVTGTVEVAPGSVTVTARTTRRTAILTILGIDEVTGTGSATAVPLLGASGGR